MNANILGDAASLYLRMARRVKRAGLDPLDQLVHAVRLENGVIVPDVAFVVYLDEHVAPVKAFGQLLND